MESLPCRLPRCFILETLTPHWTKALNLALNRAMVYSIKEHNLSLLIFTQRWRAQPARSDFRIAIVCALPREYNAVGLLIDQFWDDDSDTYGKVGGRSEHLCNQGVWAIPDVVLVGLPEMGKGNAR